VTADGLRDEAGEIDRAGMDGEGPLVQAGEVEQVADEPLEPPRLGDDDGGSFLDGHDAVEDRVAVAADGGERRLQLVAYGEQKAALGVAGPVEGPRRLLNEAARFATSVEPVRGSVWRRGGSARLATDTRSIGRERRARAGRRRLPRWLRRPRRRSQRRP
jgi:hypothetical protein